MTDAPKTMSLEPAEWQGIVATNTQRFFEFIKPLAAPNAEQSAAMQAYLDRMKFQVVAWERSAPQPVPEPAAQLVEASAPAAPAANGAEPKKRGGWPRGKKRNAPAQAVTQ